jgi:ribulose-phosphate 3-epimerase
VSALCASVMCADLTRLADQVRVLDAAGIDRYHWDIMDGRFVPNFALTPLLMEMARGLTATPFEAHLMIEAPEHYIDMTAKAGANRIIIHAETTHHIRRAIQHIRAAGAQAGVAINPATPPDLLRYVLPEVSTVLCMTVDPGFAGQPFARPVLEKIRTVRQMIDDLRLAVEIEVDGNINAETIPDCARAGARAFVLGSTGLFNQDDFAAALRKLRPLTNPNARLV